MNRRGFLKTILASGIAPYVVTSSGVLMPCRALAGAGVSLHLWHTEWIDPFALAPSNIMVFEFSPSTVAQARLLVRGWDSGIGSTPASPRAR